MSLSPDLSSALSLATGTTTPLSAQRMSVSDIFSNLNSFISGVNFANPTWDMFIVLFFVLAVFLYGFTLGRERIVIMLISIYMGIAILRSTDFLDKIPLADYGPNNIFVFKISVFFGMFALLFFLLSRSRVLKSTANSGSSGEWWQVIIFSFLHVGLLVSIALSFIPKEYSDSLSPFIKEWFIGDQVEFFWIISPVAAMAILREKSDE